MTYPLDQDHAWEEASTIPMKAFVDYTTLPALSAVCMPSMPPSQSRLQRRILRLCSGVLFLMTFCGALLCTVFFLASMPLYALILCIIESILWCNIGVALLQQEPRPLPPQTKLYPLDQSTTSYLIALRLTLVKEHHHAHFQKDDLSSPMGPNHRAVSPVDPGQTTYF